MSELTIVPARRPAALPAGGLAMVLAAAAVSLLLAVVAGLPKLAEGGVDNDSLMRLVTVRDLLAGQGWFDTTQYRMGLDGGLPMHWSRLVDAPIALLVLAFGETAAAFIWPTLLLLAALALVAGLAVRLGGEPARFPALVLALTAFHFSGVFSPGSFDHHNVQLVLALVVASGVLAGSVRGGLAAGGAAAVSLAVGMETLPLVAAAGCGTAVAFALRGQGERDAALGFGLGFAAAGMVALAATTPLAAWWRAACDAYSGVHAAVAVAAGIGLAGSALLTARRGPAARLAALAVTAALAGAVVAVLAPQCLADPYAGLDPRLREYWLDWVIEAQPVTTLLLHSPGQAAASYVTPLLALALLAGGIVARHDDRGRLLLALLLGVAAAVSWWQVRGAMFSLTLAAAPLSAWIGTLRAGAAAGGTAASLRLAAAWLLSFNVAWGLAVHGAMAVAGFVSAAQPAPAAPEATSSCLGEGDYAALAALPATTVLAISNLGAPILAWTPHRALAGPYHRNEAGNLAALDALLGEPDAARAAVLGGKAGLVAVCAGNEETQVLAARAPGGMLAALLGGNAPGWLEAMPGEGPLRLYRVTGAIAP